jgi:hypothetical protein
MNVEQVLKWMGTLGGIMGAFLVAANVPISGWGYIPFLIGAGALVGWGLFIREPAVWILNGVYCVANLIGIWRWLLGPIFR